MYIYVIYFIYINQNTPEARRSDCLNCCFSGGLIRFLFLTIQFRRDTLYERGTSSCCQPTIPATVQKQIGPVAISGSTEALFYNSLPSTTRHGHGLFSCIRLLTDA